MLMIMPTYVLEMPKELGEAQKKVRYRKMYSCLTKQVMLFLLSTPVPRPPSMSFRRRLL
jgi:hypothetical protein